MLDLVPSEVQLKEGFRVEIISLAFQVAKGLKKVLMDLFPIFQAMKQCTRLIASSPTDIVRLFGGQSSQATLILFLINAYNCQVMVLFPIYIEIDLLHMCSFPMPNSTGGLVAWYSLAILLLQLQVCCCCTSYSTLSCSRPVINFSFCY